ncbi:YqjF family protein [Halosimplex amylolyticum]|uniref:YqjF family protein n=1 Tax=Halosimplex amylolyticum TaxID=3396616 RepID=UPI003F553A9C
MSLRSLVSLPIDMGWRHVLFANWPVDPDLVDAHLPESLTVDTYEGRAWLSVVPFTNVAVRPHGLPAWTGFRLPELNLRTYVTHEGEAARADGDTGPRDDAPAADRGVYFFNLDADGVLGVTGARVFHHLPYYFANMSLTTAGSRVAFTSERWHPGARPCDFDARYEPVGDRFRFEPGSLDEFLTERYRYYTETPGGELRYAQIRHPPWPLYEATVDVGENEVFEANGFATPDSEPVFRYSPGVDVTASGSRPVE